MNRDIIKDSGLSSKALKDARKSAMNDPFLKREGADGRVKTKLTPIKPIKTKR